MNYKPDESTLMAYLYGELPLAEQEAVERYLAENPAAQEELKKMQDLRSLMQQVQDQEVLAPPIVIEPSKRLFDIPYLRTILAVAASLLLVLLVGRLTGARLEVTDNTFAIAFGERKMPVQQPAIEKDALTAAQVQQMINSSLTANNEVMKEQWSEVRDELDESIQKNLASNSHRINNLVKEASLASEDQIRDFASSMQTQNMQLVKDYFQLTANEQKQYIEDLLVDFSRYLQQQRTDDMVVVERRLNSLEQNTNVFKQETEQILSSIISNANVRTYNKN